MREPWELTRSPTSVGRGSWTRSVAVIIELTSGGVLAGRSPGVAPGDALGDRADVVGGRAAAAADDADVVALDELAEHVDEICSGVSGKIVSPSGPCSGRPAFGMQ